ncbi:MAG: acyl-CoA thioesterase [Candidatus Omnitrophica bacterium]|nr:acyl-CoA thioesterase [Candidatus Omnitrophota bacterium]
MFTYKTTIKLHETDAAGLLFFSQQFKLIHDAYEELLDSRGIGFSVMLREKSYFLPIVHAESDYKKPLFVGDRLTIKVSVSHIGETSFSFSYQLLKNSNILVGTAKTVHVTISKKTGKKIPLPKEMRKALGK